jgi:hypothetical protein
VDETQAKKLVLAQAESSALGTLWFALRGGDKAEVVAGQRGRVDLSDLLAGDEVRAADSSDGGATP